MVAWAYDSYCTDNVFETVEEWDHIQLEINKMLEDVFDQILPDYPTESDLEFLIGMVIWCIRSKFEVNKEYLETSNELIKYLLEHGIFKDWTDKEKRKCKLNHEKNIIKNVIVENEIPDLVIKKKNNKIFNKYA